MNFGLRIAEFGLKASRALCVVALLVLSLFIAPRASGQIVTASVTFTNLTTNGMTFSVNGDTRTFTNNVVVSSSQVLTNSDATGSGSKTNLFIQVGLNPFSSVNERDTGSNTMNLISFPGQPLVLTLSAGFASFSYSTQTVSTLIGVRVPYTSETVTVRTNVASGIVQAINGAENTNQIQQTSTAAGQLAGLTNNQTISGAKRFIGQAYMTNAIVDHPTQTNTVNYGSAISSIPNAGAGGNEQFGAGATASGGSSLAVGNSASSGDDSVAVGSSASATAAGSVAVGNTATAGGNFSTVAIGSASSATANNSVAFGNIASASAPNGSALGNNSLAAGTNSTAVGTGASAYGQNAVVLGANSTATTNNSTALGANASSPFTNSTAVGTGATNTAPNQVMLGALGSSTVIPNTLSVGGQGTFSNVVASGGALFSGPITNAQFYGLTTFTNGADVAFARQLINTLSSGPNADLPVGSNVFVEVSGPGAPFSINGIANGRDGKVIYVLNQTGQTMTIANESGTESTAANRIRTLTGGDVGTQPNSLNEFIYSGSASRWILLNAPNIANGIQSLVFTNSPTPTVIGNVGYIPSSLLTNNFMVIDQWVMVTNPVTHTLNWSNFVTGLNGMAIDTNAGATFFGAMTGNGSTLTNALGGNLIGQTNTVPVAFFGNMCVSNSTVTNNNLLLGMSGPSKKVTGLANTIGVLNSAGGAPSFGTTLQGAYQYLFGGMFTHTITNVNGSAASMTELPKNENDIRRGMLKPALGVTTDNPNASASNPLPDQTNYLYMLNVAKYFNTSGIAGVLSNYGATSVFLGDNSWLQTNRDATGGLQVLPGLFAGGVSNTIYQCHTNGMAVVLANYYATTEPNTGDTDYRCDITGVNQNSYPSQASSSGVTYTFPMTVPDKAANDVKWFQTNFVDGFFVQDAPPVAGEQNYYHQDSVQIADAAMFINTSDSGRVFWRNYVNLNNAPHIDGSLTASQFLNNGTTQYLPHQLWVGHFQDHPSTETQYYCNMYSGNSAPAGVGSDTGLKVGMEYVRAYDVHSSNWDGGNLPLFQMNSTGHSASDYTNYYACVGEFNAFSANQMTTNPFGGTVLFGAWETNQDQVCTNAGFLSVWTDVEHYPRDVFDDFTNTVRIRKYGNNGAFAVLSINQGAVTTNLNLSLCSVDSSPAGSIGVVTNQIYAITNVYEGTFVSLFTNNLITNLPSASKSWVTLTPYVIPRLVLSNLTTVTANSSVTNPYLRNIELRGTVGTQAGSSVSTAYSSAVNVTESIGGNMTTNELTSSGGLGPMTNAHTDIYSIVLGPGDWTTFNVSTTGNGSTTSFVNFRMTTTP